MAVILEWKKVKSSLSTNTFPIKTVFPCEKKNNLKKSQDSALNQLSEKKVEGASALSESYERHFSKLHYSKLH